MRGLLQKRRSFSSFLFEWGEGIRPRSLSYGLLELSLGLSNGRCAELFQEYCEHGKFVKCLNAMFLRLTNTEKLTVKMHHLFVK